MSTAEALEAPPARVTARPEQVGRPEQATAGKISWGADSPAAANSPAANSPAANSPAANFPAVNSQEGTTPEGTEPGTTEPGTAAGAGAPQDQAEATARPEADTWAYVDAAQNGDADAFARLYDQYSQVVYRYVFFRVSDHCLAEDITSETFLRALRRIATISYQGRDVAAWFITIAKNLVLDHVKSSRHRLEVPTHDLAHTWSAQGHQQVGPEQHVLTAAAHLELVRCVRALNPEQRECIRLRFGQGLSVTETAARMRRNEGAVKALQHRAVRRLAQLLPDDPR